MNGSTGIQTAGLCYKSPQRTPLYYALPYLYPISEDCVKSPTSKSSIVRETAQRLTCTLLDWSSTVENGKDTLPVGRQNIEQTSSITAGSLPIKARRSPFQKSVTPLCFIFPSPPPDTSGTHMNLTIALSD